MLRLWRRNVWTVKKVSGDTRIWTMDLSDCSRLLYHWAISPRGDKVFRRERQVAMMSWFQSHLAAKKSYGAVRLKVLQYSDLPVSVGGIMVSIAAFQAVDPGSIPGRRNFFQIWKGSCVNLFWAVEEFPRGLTARISGFHPGGPGSTPGVGTLFSWIFLKSKFKFYLLWTFLNFFGGQKGVPLPGIEPGPPGWEPDIQIFYVVPNLIEPLCHQEEEEEESR